ncbi:MAG: hypothetical protein JST82_12295 [Bacteroidetes bacterium]|nr:hypothetical protein [Bacteroidota bacterium]
MLFLVIGQGLHLYSNPSQGKCGKIILPPQNKHGRSSVRTCNDDSIEQTYLLCNDIEDDDMPEIAAKKDICAVNFAPDRSYRSILSFLHRSYTAPPVVLTFVTCKYILQRVLLL